MGVEFSNGFGDLSKRIFAQASDQMHEALAQGLAERAREHGLSSADNIKLETALDSDASELEIDAERVRARANAILAGD